MANKKLLTDNEPAFIVEGGEPHMKSNPRSRQAEGKNSDETSQITMKVKPTTTLAEPEARVTEGFDTIYPVNRVRPEGSPEAARQRNNRARDLRTNLGVGHSSKIVLD
jgi:hypothetical protein